MSTAGTASPNEPGVEPRAEPQAGGRKRYLLLLAAAIPVAALFSLLAWGVVRSGGTPGGFGINNSFGEVAVEPGPAPEFAADTLEGVPLVLSALRGRVVMLDFWSSWCPPCRREAPALAQVYREYLGSPVEFVGIAIWDDPGRVSTYVEEFDLPYPNVLDDRGRIAIDYGVSGIPEKFFIDPQGNLVREFVGPMEAEDLRSILDSLLEESTELADLGGLS